MAKYQKLESGPPGAIAMHDENFTLLYTDDNNGYSNNNNNNNNNTDNSSTSYDDSAAGALGISGNLAALDVDDSTMEVPLLNNNNNNDHTYEQQHPQRHQQQQQHYGADTLCYCEQPGFGVNLQNKSAQEAKFKILLAISLCCVFMIIEFLGGYLAGSLAIMTDAAHLASDCISFVIGLVAIWLGSRPPDKRMSFGYKRMEVMGAIVSILGIWILTATLIIVAAQRLYSNDYELNATTMMVISGIGILINIVMVYILHGSSLLQGNHAHAHAHGHGHNHAHAHTHTNAPARSHTNHQRLHANGNATPAIGNGLKHASNCDISHEKNLNLRAAMIHVIGDLVQSIGVFFASVLIQFYPSAKFADPMCTLIFSVIVIMTTVRLFRESVGVLLDAVPPNIALDRLETDLSHIDGIKSVHHLNVWSHTANHNVMMVHLVIDFFCDSNTVLDRATQLVCGPKYNIKHCTIQVERLSS